MNTTNGPQTSLPLGQADADVFNITMTRYTTAAGVVILLYDCLLTIGDEVIVEGTW